MLTITRKVINSILKKEIKRSSEKAPSQFAFCSTKFSQQRSCNEIDQLKCSSGNDLKFDNAAEVFGHRSTRELIRNFLVLYACALEPLVKQSYLLMKTGERLLGPYLLGKAIGPFYRQFVAGNSEAEMKEISDHLSSVGINLMIAPTLETDVGESEENRGKLFEKNFIETLNLIEISSRCRPPTTSLRPVCQTKITAHLSADNLCNISSVYEAASPDERISAVRELSIAMQELKGIKHNYIRHEPALKCLKLSKLNMREEDMLELKRTLPRLVQIGNLCKERNVILAVDAEYSYVNPAISFIVLAMMVCFNEDLPVIWNTYQGYLKNTKGCLVHDYDLIQSFGSAFGAKIVRGAYMEKEREHAKLQKTPDPVNDTYALTNELYDSLIDFLVQKVATSLKQCQMMAATHNEASILNATYQMEIRGILPSNPSFLFAQIYGMAENISIPLAKGGYCVYKSVPYGSITDVLPYLSRRANENRAVFKGARRERKLLSEELKNRMVGIFKDTKHT